MVQAKRYIPPPLGEVLTQTLHNPLLGLIRPLGGLAMTTEGWLFLSLVFRGMILGGVKQQLIVLPEEEKAFLAKPCHGHLFSPNLVTIALDPPLGRLFLPPYEGREDKELLFVQERSEYLDNIRQRIRFVL